MSKEMNNEFRLLPLVAAMLLAYGPAYAEDNSEVQGLMTPESFVSAGVGTVNNSNDARRFSQYTGLNQSTSALLDVELNKRNNETGLWTTFTGRNLGLDTREFSFSQNKQGNWRYAIDYNEIVRRDPYTIHTGMTGIGTTTPTINLIATPPMPATWATANGLAASNGVQGSDVQLQMKRTAFGVSGDKWLNPELQIEVSFRNEDKKGARMFGRAGLDSGDMGLRPANGPASATSSGTVANANGGWAVLLTPEPINSTTQQLEAKLNFNRNKLALTGGYYGSFYINNNGNLSPNVPGTLNRGALWNGCNLTAPSGAGCSTVQQLASSSVALPPDNQAHQFYASGNYAFTDTTRGNFKLSYTHATQNESFAAQGLTPSAFAPASLGGVVDTTLAQLGLTMRPLKELTVNTSLRYEDRADKTPIYVYNTNGITGSALNGTTNWPSGSQTRTTAKLDGIYRFASGYSVALGGDWERKVTPLPPANTSIFSRQVFFRPVMDEYGVHTELRKALSETLSGALGLEYKDRRGKDSDWATTTGTAGNALVAFNPALPASGTTAALSGGNYVLPDLYMDRTRTKVRGNLEWEATEKLSLQTVLEHAQDNYNRAIPAIVAPLYQVVPVVAGARTIITDSLALDSTYMVAEGWKMTGYVSRSYNRWNVNKVNIGDDTRNTADTLGLGVNGKVTSRVDIGMDILATRDTTTFNNVVAYGTGATLPNAAGNIAGWNGQTLPGNYLPSINYRTRKVNLHGKYAVSKDADVQMMFIYQQFRTDDWQWGYNGVPFLYSDNTTVSQPMNQNLKFFGASYLLRF